MLHIHSTCLFVCVCVCVGRWVGCIHIHVHYVCMGVYMYMSVNVCVCTCESIPGIVLCCVSLLLQCKTKDRSFYNLLKFFKLTYSPMIRAQDADH